MGCANSKHPPAKRPKRGRAIYPQKSNDTIVQMKDLVKCGICKDKSGQKYQMYREPNNSAKFYYDANCMIHYVK